MTASHHVLNERGVVITSHDTAHAAVLFICHSRHQNLFIAPAGHGADQTGDGPVTCQCGWAVERYVHDDAVLDYQRHIYDVLQHEVKRKRLEVVADTSEVA